MFTSVNINYVRWQLRLENQLKCQLRRDTKYLTILYLGDGGQLWCACRLQREACILRVVNLRADIALYDYGSPPNRVSNCDTSRRRRSLFHREKSIPRTLTRPAEFMTSRRETIVDLLSLYYRYYISRSNIITISWYRQSEYIGNVRVIIFSVMKKPQKKVSPSPFFFLRRFYHLEKDVCILWYSLKYFFALSSYF